MNTASVVDHLRNRGTNQGNPAWTQPEPTYDKVTSESEYTLPR